MMQFLKRSTPTINVENSKLVGEDSVASTLLLKNWNSSGPLEQLLIAPTLFLLLNAVKDRLIVYKMYNFIKGT